MVMRLGDVDHRGMPSLPNHRLDALRYGLPALLVAVGFVLLFTVDGAIRWDGWAMCVGSGLSVLLLNALFRYGAQSDHERDEEVAARDYLAKHGHWPDEES
jgi:hypothetical protein